jgi:hypothetical protein
MTYVFSVEDAAGNSRARERVDGLKKNQAASETRHTGVSALRASPIDRTADHWLTPAAIASRLCEPVRTNAKHKRNDFFMLRLSNGYTAAGNLGGGNIQLHTP